MTSISIVLATYNGAAFLERQLDTLAAQSLLPDELIVTDDRSTDSTVDIARAFARGAPFPVHVEVNDWQLNFRGNFYKGVGLASSDLIMFCDQDDVWRPEKLAVMKARFDADPALLLAYHHATVVDVEERPLGPVSDPDEQAALVRAALPPPWYFARGLLQTFRRSLTRFDDLLPLSREHFSDDIFGHDRWYFFLALAMGGLAFVDRDLLLYRQHGANAFGSDRQRTLLGRAAERLRHHADADLHGATGARSRVAILRALTERVDDAHRPRLTMLADAYQTYAERLDRRYATFASPRLSRRAASLCRSMARGDYRGNPWGFDPLSIMRDAVSGVGQLGDRLDVLQK